MTHKLDRREFLRRTAGATAALALGGCVSGPTPEDAGPLYEISLAEWSLHNALFGRDPDLKIDNLGFAAKARELGCGAVEYVNQFFKDKTAEEAYLGKVAQAAADAGVKNVLIMVDGEGHLGDPDKNHRQTAIENHHKWVEAAKFLGCHSIRVNARSSGTYQEQMDLAADGLRRLSEFADPHGINVIVENHGGLSSNGAWLAATIAKTNHPRCGTLPDFGNFRIGGDEQYDRYKGVAEMMPYAKAVSAKSYDFDDQGNETTIDYSRMMKIVVEHGYRSWVGVEYGGSRLSETDGIIATRKLLERVRDELSQPAVG